MQALFTECDRLYPRKTLVLSLIGCCSWWWWPEKPASQLCRTSLMCGCHDCQGWGLLRLFGRGPEGSEFDRACCSCVCSVPRKVSTNAVSPCVLTESLCTEWPCRGLSSTPETAQMLHPFLHFVYTRHNARLVLGPEVWLWGLRWLCCLLETGLPIWQDSPRTYLLRSSSKLWCEAGRTGILHLERDPSMLHPKGCLQSTWDSVIQPTTPSVFTNKVAAAGPPPWWEHW